MSTILAIQTHSPLESIIIAADRQRSNEEEGSKQPIPKLFSGDFWVMGDVGGDEVRELNRFYGTLKGDRRYGSDKENGRRIIEEAIEKGRFTLVDELNAKLSKKNKGDYESPHKFVLAVNRPKTGLWLVDEWGNLIPPSDDEDKEFDYICIGSGTDSVEKHIKYLLSQEKIDRSNINTSGGIQTAQECMKAAENQDLATGLGYDLYILTKEDINEISKRIKKGMTEAYRKETATICEEYSEIEKEVIN